MLLFLWFSSFYFVHFSQLCFYFGNQIEFFFRQWTFLRGFLFSSIVSLRNTTQMAESLIFIFIFSYSNRSAEQMKSLYKKMLFFSFKRT